MAISHLTKAQLMDELETARKYAKTLEQGIKTLERYKQYEEMADELKAMRDAFINSGFTEAQAQELLMELVREGIRKGIKSSQPSNYIPRGLHI